MNLFEQTAAWFADPANWTGPAGIPASLAEHLFYSGLNLVIAAAIAVPPGTVRKLYSGTLRTDVNESQCPPVGKLEKFLAPGTGPNARPFFS